MSVAFGVAGVVILIIGVILGLYISDKAHEQMFTGMTREQIRLAVDNERLRQIIDKGFEWEG